MVGSLVGPLVEGDMLGSEEVLGSKDLVGTNEGRKEGSEDSTLDDFDFGFDFRFFFNDLPMKRFSLSLKPLPVLFLQDESHSKSFTLPFQGSAQTEPVA